MDVFHLGTLSLAIFRMRFYFYVQLIDDLTPTFWEGFIKNCRTFCLILQIILYMVEDRSYKSFENIYFLSMKHEFYQKNHSR